MRRQKKRAKYMNRKMLVLSLVGYVAMLVLLLVMDIVIINRDREEQIRSVELTLTSSTEKLVADIDTMTKYLFNIYESDPQFQILAENPESEKGDYSSAYDLNSRMKMNREMSTWLDGYYLAYGDGNNLQWLFNVNKNRIPFEEGQRIRNILLSYVEGSDTHNGFFLQTEGGNGYWLVFYKRGNAVVAGVNQINHYFSNTIRNVSIEENLLWDSKISDKNFDLYRKSFSLQDMEWEQKEILWKHAGKEYLFGQKIDACDIWYFCQISESYLHQMSVTEMVLLIFTAVSIVVMFFIYRNMVKSYLHPMYQLVTVMEEIRNGKIQEIPDLHLQYYEQQLINWVLQKMVQEIKEQKMQVYEEKLNRRDAELQLMRTQLNPHFYLNGLKTLNAMAADTGMTSMQELILRISDFLRTMLYMKESVVDAEQEIKITENYLELQKILSDREITYKIEMADDVQRWLVPVLAVQTFVENSIKYAKMEMGKTRLKITITLHKLQMEEGEKLDIMVSDSGQGYPEELLEELNTRGSYRAEGVGVNNLKKRCDILYGEKAEYSFYNMGGAVSELILPFGRKDTGDTV